YRDNSDDTTIKTPIAEYHFDECSWNGTADEVKDSSGNSHHGKAINSATTHNEHIINRSGKFEKASSQYVQMDGLDDLFGTSSSAFTFTTWIKPSSLSSAQTNHETKNTFMAKASDSKNDNIEIGVNPNGTVHVYLDTKQRDKYADFGQAGDISANSWHFVAVTYENGKVTVVIDNKTYTDTTTWVGATNIDKAVGSPLTLGSSIHIDNYFDGFMDEVKLFNTALTSSEITTIYNNENNGTNWDGTVRVAPVCIVSQVSINDVTQKEDETPFTFTLSLDVPAPMNTSVSYTINDGNATNGGNATVADNDYVADTQVVTFLAGELTKTISVNVIADTKMESNEEFYVDLNTPTLLTIVKSRGVGTIINDDTPIFNVERTNSLVTYQSDNNLDHKYKLYTQVAKKDFNYTIVSYDENSSNTVEKAVSDITVKVELVNGTDSNDSTKVLTTSVATFNNSSRIDIINNGDLTNTPATKYAYYNIYYPVDTNDSIIRNSSCTTVACLEGLANFKEFRSIISKDAFAIRPAGFSTEMWADDGNTRESLQNNKTNSILSLAAGYPYELEINALNYLDTVEENYIPQRYIVNGSGQTVLHRTQDVNTTLEFTGSETKCAVTDDIDYDYFEFTNGENDFKEFKHDNVGEYTLKIVDENWTNTDHFNQTIKGCVLNSSSNDPSQDSYGRVGCNIASTFNSSTTNYYDMQIEFEAYKFNLTNTEIVNPFGKNYIYMNNLEKDASMGIDILSTIVAQGYEDTNLSNFTTGCFSRDVNLTLHTDFNNTTNKARYGIKSLNDVNISNEAIHVKEMSQSLDVPSDKFLDENEGNCSIKIRYNIGKEYNQTKNPVEVLFQNFDSNSTYFKDLKPVISTTSSLINKSQIFYYAKVASSLEHYPPTNKTSINTPLFIEVYCKTDDGNQSWCKDDMNLTDNGIIPNGQKTYKGWYLATQHDSATEGN
ncbi:MAG TPA: hypothetical protein ENK79_01305, partial [Campylobacterales bacterium]|nr:hypothetical protein [Campylobacterales bacterium]